MNGFKHGFDLGYRGPVSRTHSSSNIPFHIGDEVDMWNKIMQDVKLCRCAGPYHNIPFTDYVQSLIGLVPKAGNKTRLIFHLSYDFGTGDDERSLNHYISESFTKVQYRDLDDAVRNCIRMLKDNYWNQAPRVIYFAKTDLVSAFKLAPVLVKQRRYLIMKARYPGTQEWCYFVMKNLPFGCASSCKIFQQFSDCLQYIVEAMADKKFIVTNYLEDFLFIATSEAECNGLVRIFLSVCERLGCPVSAEKTEWARTSITFLGIVLNGEIHKLLIPDDKRLKAIRLIKWALEQKKITVKQVQKLTGTLNFLTKAIIPGRTFTRNMYNKLKVKRDDGTVLKQYHHVHLGKDFRGDCEMWLIFLEKQCEQIARPFADLDENVNILTLDFFTDACLSKKFAGVGGVYGTRWFAARLCTQDITADVTIESLELLAVVTGILLWGSEFANSRVKIFCDNTSVQGAVNNLTTKSQSWMTAQLLRLLVLDNIIYNRRVQIEFVSSEDNDRADPLSCGNLSLFQENVRETMVSEPENIPRAIESFFKLISINDPTY